MLISREKHNREFLSVQKKHARSESLTRNNLPGMFPYVCLATMPLFCRMDWPRRLGRHFNWKRKVSAADVKPIDEDRAKATDGQTKDSPRFGKRATLSSSEVLDGKTMHEGERQFFFFLNEVIYILRNSGLKHSSRLAGEKQVDRDNFTGLKSGGETYEGDNVTQLLEKSIKSGGEEEVNVREKIPRALQATKVTKKQKLVVSVLLCHIALQFFLPYSHFISKVQTSPMLSYFILRYLIHLFRVVLK